jgi:hypothetical protein
VFAVAETPLCGGVQGRVSQRDDAYSWANLAEWLVIWTKYLVTDINGVVVPRK